MKYLYLPMLLFFLANQTLIAQNKEFRLSAEFPEAGQKVTLIYEPEMPLPKYQNPDVTVHFAGVKDYQKVAYAWDNDYKAEQVYQLKPDGNRWTCDIAIPAKARIFFVTRPRGKYTAASPEVVCHGIIYKNKRPVSGAYILSAYNQNSLNDQPISTINDIDYVNILDSYRKEFELYPDSPFNLSFSGIVGPGNREALLKKATEFEKSNAEKVMMMARGILRAIWQTKKPDSVNTKLPAGVNIGDSFVYPYRQQADSLDEVIKAKFPHGITMKAALTTNYFKEKDFKKKQVLLAHLLKRCPQDAANTRALLQTESAIYYLQDFEIPNYQKQFRLLKKDDETLAYNANEIIYHWALKDAHLPESEIIAKQVLAIATTLLKKPANKPYRAAHLSGYYSYLDTYAYILFKRHKLIKAIKQQSAVYRATKGANAEMNEHYVQMLNAAGQYQPALQVARNCIKQQKYTPKLYDEYKIAYDKAHGIAGDFPADSAALITKPLKNR